MCMQPGDSVEVSFSPRWEYNASTVPVPVNQFLFQLGVPVDGHPLPGDIILTFGHVNPPVVLPTPTGEIETPGLSEPRLPVVVVGQMIMTLDRARELSSKLSEWIEQIDSQGGTAG